MKICATESDHQVSLFDWAEWQARANASMYGDLDLLYAIPNGGVRPARLVPMPDGTIRRVSVAGQQLRREGVKAGVPDTHLPVARTGFIGCYLELKQPDRYADPNQRQMLFALHARGHFCGVCHGWEEARDWLLAYLDGALYPADHPSPKRVRVLSHERHLLTNPPPP